MNQPNECRQLSRGRHTSHRLPPLGSRTFASSCAKLLLPVFCLGRACVEYLSTFLACDTHTIYGGRPEVSRQSLPSLCRNRRCTAKALIRSERHQWPLPPTWRTFGRKCRLFLALPIIVILTLSVQGCATSTKPSPAAGPNPLVVASCPELTPLADDTFGATTRKLVEVAGIYRECREAALGVR